MNKELKPCPFCGGESNYNNDSFGEWIECSDCGCTSTHYSWSKVNRGKAKTYEAWNTRPEQQPSKELKQFIAENKGYEDLNGDFVKADAGEYIEASDLEAFAPLWEAALKKKIILEAVNKLAPEQDDFSDGMCTVTRKDISAWDLIDYANGDNNDR